MNKYKNIICMVLLLLFFALLTSSYVITIALGWIIGWNLSTIATIFVTISVALIMGGLAGLAILSLLMKPLQKFFPGVEISWPSKIFLATISILTAWLSAITMLRIGVELLIVYNLPNEIGGVILTIGILLFMLANNLAFTHVIPPKGKRWGYAVIVIVLGGISLISAINYYRKDYYNPKTGVVKVYITPSSKKIWREKPDWLQYDPETGEEIRLAEKDEINALRLKKEDEKKKPTAPATSRPQDTSWKQLTITEEPQIVGRVLAGHKVQYKSPKGFWIKGEDSNESYKNPSAYAGEIREFSILETINSSGEDLRVYTKEDDRFQLFIKIKK